MIEPEPCLQCGGTGVVDEVRCYRQPPPGDAVFEKVYRPPPESTVVRVPVVRSCIRCGGRGHPPEARTASESVAAT